MITGTVYCLACFLAYFALGLGLLSFIKLFSGYGILNRLVEIATIATLAVLAAVSFADAWRYGRTGESSSVALQLPGRIKAMIHRVMKAGLSYSFLVPGIFGAGILVTGLEAVCTGQVYVPVLVFLAKEPGGGLCGLLYLLLYNLMFVAPLIAIFVAACLGAGTLRLVRWGRKEVVAGKIAMGLFFITLAAAMIWIG